MNNETLNKANRIRMEMTDTENMLRRIEKNMVVEITFNNGGFGCCSTQSDYLPDEEVAEIKNNIVERIRERAQARLHELQKEFDNL